MSLVRERIIKTIQTLPYELEDEIKERNTFDILKEITKTYVDRYGVEDLSEDDKECIQSIICSNDSNNIFSDKVKEKGK